MSNFERRHYNAIARVIAVHGERSKESLVYALSVVFARGNPSFDAKRFKEDCFEDRGSDSGFNGFWDNTVVE